MKKILVLILILSLSVSLAQTNNEYEKILSIVIEQFEVESIKVYSRFENSEIIEELERIKKVHENKILDSLGANFDIISPKIYDDTVTVVMDEVRLSYFDQKELLSKTSNGKVNRFLNQKFEKNRKKRPLAFISFPVLSHDRRKAIVYVYYVCGNLCGEGGTIYLEKSGEDWRPIKYIFRWLA